jgi:hypothetical protein
MHYYLKSGSLKNRQKIEADHAELLMGSIDGKSRQKIEADHAELLMGSIDGKSHVVDR